MVSIRLRLAQVEEVGERVLLDRQGSWLLTLLGGPNGDEGGAFDEIVLEVDPVEVAFSIGINMGDEDVLNVGELPLAKERPLAGCLGDVRHGWVREAGHGPSVIGDDPLSVWHLLLVQTLVLAIGDDLHWVLVLDHCFHLVDFLDDLFLL